MIWNLQAIDGLYCVGDSCFPGQGVIAVAFSGIMCAHRVAADIGKQILHTFYDKSIEPCEYNAEKRKNIPFPNHVHQTFWLLEAKEK